MDEAGSVGLDLSFVSWVFLMEPLENASLEEQVISRAHRMGAKAAVQVETLVMRVRSRQMDKYSPSGRHTVQHCTLSGCAHAASAYAISHHVYIVEECVGGRRKLDQQEHQTILMLFRVLWRRGSWRCGRCRGVQQRSRALSRSPA